MREVALDDPALVAFLTESNRIEEEDPPDEEEAFRAVAFLNDPTPTAAVLSEYVAETSMGQLRDREGLDVRIGDHLPPRGGPRVAKKLDELFGWAVRIVDDASRAWQDPRAARAAGRAAGRLHIAYERLHPFTDGNGRSGRLLWAWVARRTIGAMPTEFLRPFYYYTLGELGGVRSRGRGGRSCP